MAIARPTGTLDSFWRVRPDFDMSVAMLTGITAALGISRYDAEPTSYGTALVALTLACIVIYILLWWLFNWAAEHYKHRCQDRESHHWTVNASVMLAKACQTAKAALRRCRKSLTDDTRRSKDQARLRTALMTVNVFQPDGGRTQNNIASLDQSQSLPLYEDPSSWLELDRELSRIANDCFDTLLTAKSFDFTVEASTRVCTAGQLDTYEVYVAVRLFNQCCVISTVRLMTTVLWACLWVLACFLVVLCFAGGFNVLQLMKAAGAALALQLPIGMNYCRQVSRG